MSLPDGIREKILRAETHFRELQHELNAFYQSSPGEVIMVPASADKPRHILYRQRRPMPLQFGLILGDCLQCLRSSLDYLAWELVIAHGKRKPTAQTAFPIKLTVEKFTQELVSRKRLDGIDPAAIALIRAFQPYNFDPPNSSPLAALEELSNINKHRRILFTNLIGTFTEPQLDIPYLHGEVTFFDGNGLRRQAPVWAFARLQDGCAKNVEITIFVDTLLRYVWNVVFGEFSHFFR